MVVVKAASGEIGQPFGSLATPTPITSRTRATRYHPTALSLLPVTTPHPTQSATKDSAARQSGNYGPEMMMRPEEEQQRNCRSKRDDSKEAKGGSPLYEMD